jgi:hypothetical protein
MKNKIENVNFLNEFKKSEKKKAVNISRRFRSNFRPFFFVDVLFPAKVFFLSFSEFEFGEKIKIFHFESVEIYNFFVKFFFEQFCRESFPRNFLSGDFY